MSEYKRVVSNTNIYIKKFIYEQIEKTNSPEMWEVFQSQKDEANNEFFKYISRNYLSWLKPNAAEAPIMSHTLFKMKVLPHVEKGKPLFFILIDTKKHHGIFRRYFK